VLSTDSDSVIQNSGNFRSEKYSRGRNVRTKVHKVCYNNRLTSADLLMSNFTVPLLMKGTKGMLRFTGAWTSYETVAIHRNYVGPERTCIMNFCWNVWPNCFEASHLFIRPNLWSRSTVSTSPVPCGSGGHTWRQRFDLLEGAQLADCWRWLLTLLLELWTFVLPFRHRFLFSDSIFVDLFMSFSCF
jgi:hypothetical protein